MVREQGFEHPGREFIQKYGIPADPREVLFFVNFLLKESNVSIEPPIDLEVIFDRFGIRTHDVPLRDQQGFSDGYAGRVFVKEDDPVARKRFTQAHELMEFLFGALKELPNGRALNFVAQSDVKEKLCQQGAAALLMPRGSFKPLVEKYGVNFKGASLLATRYRTSLLATIYRMLELSVTDSILVVWHYALKPTQEARFKNQPSIFGNSFILSYRKLRVWWTVLPESEPEYVPGHQSIDEESLIYNAFAEGESSMGVEEINLAGIRGRFYVEAKPVTIAHKECVLSLLRRLVDDHGSHPGRQLHP